MDLSNRSELRELAETLRILEAVLAHRGVGWVVIGATARDLILQHGHGIDTGRKTNDIDLALTVDSWEEYDSIREDLVAKGGRPDRRRHRLRIGHYDLDVIPFGGLARSYEIDWPSSDTSMNVLGLEEALAHATEVRLAPDLLVRVATVPALAIVKIIAWQDRRYERPGVDAVDLRLMIARYADWNGDRLYESDIDLLERHAHDAEMTAAALLGRDIRRIANESTNRHLIDILTQELSSDGLAREMGGGDVDRNLAWLDALLEELEPRGRPTSFPVNVNAPVPAPVS